MGGRRSALVSCRTLRQHCEGIQANNDTHLGVYDAIKNQYLQSLLFGIATNMEGTSLLEVSMPMDHQEANIACKAFAVQSCQSHFLMET